MKCGFDPCTANNNNTKNEIDYDFSFDRAQLV